MKIVLWTLAVFLLVPVLSPARAETLSDRWPIKGIKQIRLPSGDSLKISQEGDVTSVSDSKGTIMELRAPEFVKGIVQSQDKKTVVILVWQDRSSGDMVAADYHSLLHLRFTDKPARPKARRLMVRGKGAMRDLTRAVMKLDSILNDGRTVRLFFGGQEEPDDPSMQMKYSWQIWDIDSEKVYREEKSK